MKIKTLSKLKNLKGKIILVRVDFNVPMKNGKIKEMFKIDQALPTINYLVKNKAKIILLSHLGRPKEKDLDYSLKPIAKELSEKIKNEVRFQDIEETYLLEEKSLVIIKKDLAKLKNGSVVLFENTRFWPGDEKNSPKLSKALADLADLFVIDGFAVAHREASSVSGVAKHLPTVAGLLMEKEIKGLSKLLDKPKKPFVAVIGGAKMETKVPLIKKLLPKVDCILVAGGVANTCLWAKGYKIGKSIIDKNYKKEALLYWSSKKIIMPQDVVVGDSAGGRVEVVKINKKTLVKNRELAIYDIGPETVRIFADIIKTSNTLVWNGALGYFEQTPYDWSSKTVARLFGERSKGKAFGVTGGGETVELVKKLHLTDEIDLVSTGGGAMLEFLSGKLLPGIKAVIKK